MIKLLNPIVEQRLDNTEPSTRVRKKMAEDICRFLKADPEGTSSNETLERKKFYDACEALLRNEYSRRILLYLPLGLLEDAPDRFRQTYRDTWFRMSYIRDIRENFHIGDCFEPDARPPEGLERVVKCAHLTPWLLKFKYIDTSDVLQIIEERGDNLVLLQSFKDTWNYMYSQGIINATELRQLSAKTAHLPSRIKQEPLYISEKRLEWLREKDRPVKLLTPSAKLEGPFSGNLPAVKAQIEEIASRLLPSEIVLVGGSQLKGYGTIDSDLDIWNLQELEKSEEFKLGSPHASHIYFNTMWLVGKAVTDDELRYTVNRITSAYKHLRSDIKKFAIERLESDLLQYRLLHKGFARFIGIDKFDDLPTEMDGDSPFYHDEYRQIATMLFAKYVWI